MPVFFPGLFAETIGKQQLRCALQISYAFLCFIQNVYRFTMIPAKQKKVSTASFELRGVSFVIFFGLLRKSMGWGKHQFLLPAKLVTCFIPVIQFELCGGFDAHLLSWSESQLLYSVVLTAKKAGSPCSALSLALLLVSMNRSWFTSHTI